MTGRGFAELSEGSGQENPATVRFSSRVQADLAINRLAQAVGRLQAAGQPFIDLTESNPTRVGFDYPPDLFSPLTDVRALTYSPQPFGMPDARQAVAGDYARRGISLDADHIMLTSSTSEAYSLLFKVLCDSDDEVVVPRPSYPLFEHLARLDAVRIKPYFLEYHGVWSIDLDSIERACSPRTRAVLLVTPNNPTGSFVTWGELDRIAALCSARGVALIGDEVFADYELEPGTYARCGHILDHRELLVFSLGGLSKTVGLPQAKLGWIGVGGPQRALESALARLELACDTYLSVSTPVQVAAAELFRRGASVRQQIQQRITANYRLLVAGGAKTPACDVLHAEGGWYAILRVPSFCPEEDLVLQLLADARVLVHPGYFFDFPHESYIIVSLLAAEDLFATGISRMLRHFDCTVAPTVP